MCIKNIKFIWRPLYIYDTLLIFFFIFLEWEMFQTKIVEKMKTHIMLSNFFFFKNDAIYEIMWRNIVQPDRPHMTL